MTVVDWWSEFSVTLNLQKKPLSTPASQIPMKNPCRSIIVIEASSRVTYKRKRKNKRKKQPLLSNWKVGCCALTDRFSVDNWRKKKTKQNTYLHNSAVIPVSYLNLQSHTVSIIFIYFQQACVWGPQLRLAFSCIHSHHALSSIANTFTCTSLCRRSPCRFPCTSTSSPSHLSIILIGLTCCYYHISLPRLTTLLWRSIDRLLIFRTLTWKSMQPGCYLGE